MLSNWTSSKNNSTSLLKVGGVLLMMTSLSLGCKKNNSTDIAAELIKGSWQLIATELISVDNSRIPKNLEDCERDNIYTFSADGTWTEDAGDICYWGIFYGTQMYEYNKSTGQLTIGDRKFEEVHVNGNTLKYSQLYAYVTEYKAKVFIYKRLN